MPAAAAKPRDDRNHIGAQIGPFMYSPDASPLERRKCEGRDLIIGIASAYNAFGLIGPEHNGIFILDDTGKSVVLDRFAEQSSGYYGPSELQIAARAKLMAMTDAELMTFIRGNPNYRGSLG